MTHRQGIGFSAVVYFLFMQFAVVFLQPTDDSVVMSDDSMKEK
jgi:hypothetical protein